ncbi:ATP-binding cassette domain-containing protein [Oscillospiraceae bacterium MB08-C2-2]|nr:ATP-binding cassette domain-containing protein [Oscillospiraceae bacterium MB08-C2-2]
MAIELCGISKAYESTQVLQNVSLRFETGKSYCIMGPSGYGKTTLLHVLMGLVKADAGEITGLEGYRLAPVFQENRLCENLSAGANLRMVRPGKATAPELDAALESLGLPGALHQPVREMSGGMKRRVAIARALVSGGNLLVMDEPFKGLDHETKELVMSHVREQAMGKTMIWVTHDEREAAFMGSEMIHFPL